MFRPSFWLAVTLGVFPVVAAPALHAQEERFGGQGHWGEFLGVNVLPFDQPVIPVMEGWFENPDGSRTISFGYFNMNYEEEFDIPIGPDNFIEPSQYNGVQPTYFMAAPPEGGRRNRHESVFSVTVPPGFREDVVWTIRVRGRTYSVPGRATSESYVVDDATSGMPGMEAGTSAPVAASLRFSPTGPVARGRAGITTEPLTARVGQPLALNVWVELHGRSRTVLTWYPHQAPEGRGVAFDRNNFVVEEGGSGPETTQVTFDRPGEYLLRLTALESLGALVQHCCWTNAYVPVTVTP
jgi:hypothetical protein